MAVSPFTLLLIDIGKKKRRKREVKREFDLRQEFSLPVTFTVFMIN